MPDTRNPDWKFEKTEHRRYNAPLDTLPGGRDGMSTASYDRYSSSGSDKMPNAAQKSISSAGNRSYHWDADRQLAYTWPSQPIQSGRPEPDTVKVQEQRTGTVHTYRRIPAKADFCLWHYVKPSK